MAPWLRRRSAVTVSPVWLACLLTASASLGAPRLVLGSFNAPSLKKDLQAFLPEHLAQQLVARGLEAVSQRDIATVMGLERQRQLLGCSDSSCVAELMGALGADGIVLGEVADLEGTWVVNVKVISASAGRPLATFSTRVSRRAQLAEAVEAAATELARQLLAAPPPAPKPLPPPVEPQRPVAPTPPPRVVVPAEPVAPSRAPALVSAGAAVVLLGGATALAFLARADHQQLHSGVPLSVDEAVAVANRGAAFQAWSLGAFGVGGAAAVTSLILFLVHAPSPVSASLVVTPGGAAFAFGGRLP